MADKDITIRLNAVGAAETAEEIAKVGGETDGLAKETLKTSTSTDTLSASNTKLGESTKNSGRAMLSFSQGLEDAQYGIRGVLNNIPGLIMSLGGTSGLAASISIAAVSFSVLYEWLGKTEEKAVEVGDQIDKTASKIEKIENNRLEKLAATIDARTKASIELRNDLDETQKADDRAAVSVLDNAAKIAKAQANIAAALGLQVNHYAEISKIEEAAAAKRELLAKQAIEAQRKRLADARQAESDAERKVQDERDKRAEISARLEEARAREAVQRASKLAMEKVAKDAIPSGPNMFLPGGGMGFASNQIDSTAQANTVNDAKANLASQEFQAIGAALAKRVEILEEALKEFGGETGTIERAEVALDAATNKVADMDAAVAKNIETIEQNRAADDLLGKSAALVTSQQQQANDIKAALANVETSTSQGQKAKDALMAAAADGKITANESRNVADGLRTLMGLLQTGQTTVNGNVKDLIRMISRLQDDQANMSQQIQSLKNRR